MAMIPAERELLGAGEMDDYVQAIASSPSIVVLRAGALWIVGECLDFTTDEPKPVNDTCSLPERMWAYLPIATQIFGNVRFVVLATSPDLGEALAMASRAR